MKFYGTETSESHCPSMIQESKKWRTLPFTASIQHVRNVNLIVQSEQCHMWRLIYSPNKLKAEDKKEYSRENLIVLHLAESLSVRQLQCEEPVKKLYYSMGYESICIYYSSGDNHDIPTDSYLICEI